MDRPFPSRVSQGVACSGRRWQWGNRVSLLEEGIGLSGRGNTHKGAEVGQHGSMARLVPGTGSHERTRQGTLGTEVKGPEFHAEEFEFQLLIGGESWEVFRQSQTVHCPLPVQSCPVKGDDGKPSASHC